MIETIETAQDVEKQLAEARAKLQSFEDGVDRARLLKRLKLASPAHPVLLFRMMFLVLTALMLTSALVVLAVPYFGSTDMARRIAKLEMVIQVPQGVPGLPALLGGLALCMLVGWAMTTMAALAMGRDAQMLPWEQKQHQKLVNEVTRLTTQKAVMERMRSTPAGARPRLETPVPVSLRERSGMATPPGGSVLGSMQPGRFGSAPGAGGGDPAGNPFGRAPGSTPAPATSTATGGGLFGRAPGTGPASATPDPANPFGGYSPPSGGGGGGVLAKARSGSVKTTPAGAAGRLAPNFNRPAVGGMPEGGEEGGDDEGPFASRGAPAGGVATSSSAAASMKPAAGRPASPFSHDPPSSSPFGAAPRSRNPLSAPAAAGNPFGGPAVAAGGANPFRAAAAAPEVDPEEPELELDPESQAPPAVNVFGSGVAAGGLLSRARASSTPAADIPDIVDSGPRYSASHAAAPSASPEADAGDGPRRSVRLPKWGPIDDPWLEAAIEKAENLARALPEQAMLRFSEEAYLPFTLVISRASPTIAVKCLVSYIEFLAGIPTPPRARIELASSAGLDLSFHRNVEAALEPLFGDTFEVELEPGRVEVVFKQPDPDWQDHPDLPIEA